MISGAGKFWVWVAGGAAVAVAILLTGAFISQSKSAQAVSPKPATAAAPAARPDVPPPPRPLEVGNPRAPLVIDVYEDFLCPACAGFEHRYADQVSAAWQQGALLVRYHLLAVFDGRSASGSYSSRAAGAAICVHEEDAEAFPRFHATLFQSGARPEEGSTADLSNDQLAQLAAESGASARAADCVRQGARVEQAKAAARAGLHELSAIATGQLVTPTVVKDGKIVDFTNKEWLTKLLGG
ncbi:MAG: DsbA family protein [Segniliparus sp.]|uniref:DsbA family protein n=1 Tax=Segniliparus sp. TaxID=2804064 RepID=UPI003F2EEEC7